MTKTRAHVAKLIKETTNAPFGVRWMIAEIPRNLIIGARFNRLDAFCDFYDSLPNDLYRNKSSADILLLFFFLGAVPFNFDALRVLIVSLIHNYRASVSKLIIVSISHSRKHCALFIESECVASASNLI